MIFGEVLVAIVGGFVGWVSADDFNDGDFPIVTEDGFLGWVGDLLLFGSLDDREDLGTMDLLIFDEGSESIGTFLREACNLCVMNCYVDFAVAADFKMNWVIRS